MANPRPALIDDPFQLDAAWFNQLFAYIGTDATVTSFEAVSIGTGQIGLNIRFTFQYADNPGGAPATLVGKFPSDSDQSRAAALALNHYRREVMFYEMFPTLSEQIAPGALYTDYDLETNHFILIMNDMAPAEQGDQLAGCSVAQAEKALEFAAVLHASHWNDAILDTYDWLQEAHAAPPPTLPLSYIATLWEGFKERYGSQMDQQMIQVGDAFNANIEAWAEGYTGPRCLTHADFRLDNMLYGDGKTSRELAVVDWQTVGVRGPAIDVAYFIGAGLTREERPKHERALVEHYHRALISEGVTGYDFDQLWQDYRRFSFYGISVAFGAAMLVEQTDRGDEMFMTMMRRHTAQIVDLDAVELL